MKNNIEQYTESEFLKLLTIIVNADTNTEKELDDLIDLFESITNHPDGSDLIYYPDAPEDATPERIVQIVKEWRLSQGLPCFKE